MTDWKSEIARYEQRVESLLALLPPAFASASRLPVLPLKSQPTPTGALMLNLGIYSSNVLRATGDLVVGLQASWVTGSFIS